jgi:hypothetical protein
MGMYAPLGMGCRRPAYLPRTLSAYGVRGFCYQGWLALLAHPWLNSDHASGVEFSARQGWSEISQVCASFAHTWVAQVPNSARRKACEDDTALGSTRQGEECLSHLHHHLA